MGRLPSFWSWRILTTGFGAVLLAACDGSEVGTTLSTTEGDDGVVFESKWTYRSFEVDVTLRLRTRLAGDDCSTTARLTVNDVVSATQTYDLAPTGCASLRLSETGDIVLYEQETGYPWAEEPLSVDTSAEVISLGPVSITAPGSEEDVRYLFTLSAPVCSDDDDCTCGVLVRRANAERLELPLGRRCE